MYHLKKKNKIHSQVSAAKFMKQSITSTLGAYLALPKASLPHIIPKCMLLLPCFSLVSPPVMYPQTIQGELGIDILIQVLFSSTQYQSWYSCVSVLSPSPQPVYFSSTQTLRVRPLEGEISGLLLDSHFGQAPGFASCSPWSTIGIKVKAQGLPGLA